MQYFSVRRIRQLRSCFLIVVIYGLTSLIIYLQVYFQIRSDIKNTLNLNQTLNTENENRFQDNLPNFEGGPDNIPNIKFSKASEDLELKDELKLQEVFATISELFMKNVLKNINSELQIERNSMILSPGIHTKNNSILIDYTNCDDLGTYNNSMPEKIDQYQFLHSHPNLPRFLLTESNVSNLIPDITSIRWTAVYWQESWREDPKFLLYSAHFDDREKWIPEGEDVVYVRILGVFNGKTNPLIKDCSCNLYFNSTSNPVSVPVHNIDLIDYYGFDQNRLVPYMLSCIVPPVNDQALAPIAVSFVQKRCGLSSNILRVTGLPSRHEKLQQQRKDDENPKHLYETKTNIKVGICSQAIYYYNHDFSERLVEWLETLFVLGVSRVILYRTVVHRKVKRVLDLYEKLGKISIVDFRFPPPYVGDPNFIFSWVQKKRPQIFALETIYFTDCVLRFKDDFDYLYHLDFDEVPILSMHDSLTDLMEYAREELPPSASYILKWKLFPDDLPPSPAAANISERFYIFRHDRKPKNWGLDKTYLGKPIYDTTYVLGAHSHRPYSIVADADKKGVEKYLLFFMNEAYTGHYRDDLPCGNHCNGTGVEFEHVTRLLRHQDLIIKNIESIDEVLKNLYLSR